MRFCLALVAFCFALLPFATGAQSGPILPAGFEADVYASGLTAPTAMAFGPDGRLYVSELDGRILAIGNHRIVSVASGFKIPLGVGWQRHHLYVSSTGRISLLTPARDYNHFKRHDIVTGLPYGRHQNDNIAFDSGWLYVGVGTTCDACTERDPRSGTIMRFWLNGTHAQIVARGLRNPYGLAFRPGTHQLYATDNGRDDHDDQVPDELNRIVSGGNYGWPDCWGGGGGTHCQGTLPPAALLAPHAAAAGICFYSGATFPARYRGNAFVAEWGATIGNAPNGHRVVDIRFSGTSAASASDFAAGLQHPIAVVGDRDGSLLIADYGTGVIWHVQAS